MNKIFLTTALVCSASAFAYAHHSNISDDIVNKFHQSQPTVNLNHYSDSMVASGWDSICLTTREGLTDKSKTCLTNGDDNPFDVCGMDAIWRVKYKSNTCK